jgi:hypothetical protein
MRKNERQSMSGRNTGIFVLLPAIDLLLVLCLTSFPIQGFAESWIIQDGRARAEIVVAARPTRSASLAAEELQTYLQKMSGVRLKIVTRSSGGVPVSVYVGRSEHTDQLNLKTDGLRHGAFRIVSGPDWLALTGDDRDFVPTGPWARSGTSWENEGIKAWDSMTGSHWGNRIWAGLRRKYDGDAKKFNPDGTRNTSNGATGMWSHDTRGSLNAVYQFLRDLGVRWYMPGDLGEVVPEMVSIPLPRSPDASRIPNARESGHLFDTTVRPHFPVRSFNFPRYGTAKPDSIIWSMRLGVNDPYGLLLSHGMKNITDRQEMKEKHPEYYALYGGTRNTVRKGNQCLSSQGLFDETVKFARMMYEVYDVPMVSVMPSDGFTSLCQCPLCKGRATLDRGIQGQLSDYVWDFANRVAKELYKSYPDRLVSCGAYSRYMLPPLKIDRLSPNLVVTIVNGRVRWAHDAETHKKRDDLRKAWLEKTSHKLVIWMNHGQGAAYVPTYFPHVIARGIRDTKDQSQGEFVWLPESRGLANPTINHLNAYVQARLLWNPDRDIDALLPEYYRLFYGPAAKEMQAFVEYCEQHYLTMSYSKEQIERVLALFDAASSRVESGSVYGRRLALLDAHLAEARKRVTQLGKSRGPVPEVKFIDRDRGRWLADRDSLKLDGRLDEAFWSGMPHATGGRLKELQTGETPEFKTSFQIVWAKNALHFGIRCQDAADDPANSTTKQDDDPGIWHGDVVEVLLETESHSYYQIAINPAGAVADLDRAGDKLGFVWSSKVEVATHQGRDFWSIEARIPIAEISDDPLHEVVGRQPRENLPWFFNVCRQRVRGQTRELSAFSPTGTKKFHVPIEFGKLFLRK